MSDPMIDQMKEDERLKIEIPVEEDATGGAKTAHATADLMDEFVDLPPLVLYDLALGPMVRLVATGRSTTDDELRALRDACWRAVARPS